VAPRIDAKSRRNVHPADARPSGDVSARATSEPAEARQANAVKPSTGETIDDRYRDGQVAAELPPTIVPSTAQPAASGKSPLRTLMGHLTEAKREIHHLESHLPDADGWETRSNLDRNIGALDVDTRDYNAIEAGVDEIHHKTGDVFRWHGERQGDAVSTRSEVEHLGNGVAPAPDDRPLRERAASFASENVETSATLFAKERQTQWYSVWERDRTHHAMRSGGGYELHALAVQGRAGVALSADPKEGTLNVGVQAAGNVDLIGGSGLAKLGAGSTIRGSLYARGEAHVGARAEAGVGLEVKPRDAAISVVAGGEVFAGAEVRGSIGYHNRYAGVEVELRAQYGAGVVARGQFGAANGRLQAQADLGACVGLGGRVKVKVNVNLAAVYRDSKHALKTAAGHVAKAAAEVRQALASGWERSRDWFA